MRRCIEVAVAIVAMMSLDAELTVARTSTSGATRQPATVGARPPDPGAAQAATSKAKHPADWRQFRGGAGHRGVNRYETELSRTTVGGLTLQWVADQGFNSSPAVAKGVVYMSNGGLHAYQADCGTGGAVCSPLWVGASGYADWSSPAVADGVVYVSGGGGLSAFAVGCRSDGGLCPRLWRDPAAQAHFTSPAVAGGFVYIATNEGWLQAYDADACKKAGGVCQPTWKADLGGQMQSSPAVADGMVYVGTPDGYLDAFRVGCGSNGATCDPVWRGNIQGATVSSPAVGGGIVYMASYDGGLFAFPTSCRSTGPACDPLWHAVLPPIIHSSPAVTDTAIYVTAHRRMYAFAVGCASGGALCDPLWQTGMVTDAGSALASSPAVANGVVYLGVQTDSSTDGRLYAFPAECGKDGAVCHRLWRSPLTGGIVNASPAVSHGKVYVASNSGHLYAFGLN